MLLSPEAARALNAHCVVYTVNVDPPDPERRARMARLRAWAAKEAPHLGDLLKEAANIGPYLLGPDGRVVARVDRPFQVVGAVTRAAAEAGVEPKPPVVSTAPAWFDSYEPGDLALKLTSRFLEVPEEQVRMPRPPPWQVPMLRTVGTDDANRQMYGTRLRSPTREGVVLKAPQVEGFFPAGKTRAWDLPRDVAVELLWLFRPSTHQFRLDRRDVLQAELRATAGERRGSRLRVLVAGRSAVRQHWYPRSGEGLWLGDHLADDYWAEAPVVGYADLDLARRRVLTLKLVTDGGVYRGLDGTSLPFETVLYSVSAEEAAASCPRG